MFKFGDYTDRIPVYLPHGYQGFNQLPENYNPFLKPQYQAVPTNWVLIISGNYNN